MATCCVCSTKWYRQTLSEPAEPCDCGLNASTLEATEDEVRAIYDARRVWLKNGATWPEDQPPTIDLE